MTGCTGLCVILRVQNVRLLCFTGVEAMHSQVCMGPDSTCEKVYAIEKDALCIVCGVAINVLSMLCQQNFAAGGALLRVSET